MARDGYLYKGTVSGLSSIITKPGPSESLRLRFTAKLAHAIKAKFGSLKSEKEAHRLTTLCYTFSRASGSAVKYTLLTVFRISTCGL